MSAGFFCEGQTVTVFQFQGPYDLYHNYLSLLLRCKSSFRLICKQIWLCSNKTSFTETDSGPDLGPGWSIANVQPSRDRDEYKDLKEWFLGLGFLEAEPNRGLFEKAIYQGIALERNSRRRGGVRKEVKQRCGCGRQAHSLQLCSHVSPRSWPFESLCQSLVVQIPMSICTNFLLWTFAQILGDFWFLCVYNGHVNSTHF